MDPGKWDIIGGIELHYIHGYFCGLMVKSTDPRILGRHNLVSKHRYAITYGLKGIGPLHSLCISCFVP